jgi:rubrerythrin
VSAVVYTRVPQPLKQALQARARERGLSLNAVVCELVERGLEAIDDERASEALERARAASASELEQTRARLAEVELRLQTASEREQTTARTHRTLAERARHQLASCPQCRKPVRGTDLLVSGHCPNCSKPITAFLTPRPQLGAPDKDEYLALLGALGGLVGLALASTSENTN